MLRREEGDVGDARIVVCRVGFGGSHCCGSEGFLRTRERQKGRRGFKLKS